MAGPTHTEHVPGELPPSDIELDRRLRDEGLEPHWWSNERGYRYQLHVHGYYKVLYCASGSVTFTLPATGLRCVEGWKQL